MDIQQSFATVKNIHCGNIRTVKNQTIMLIFPTVVKQIFSNIVSCAGSGENERILKKTHFAAAFLPHRVTQSCPRNAEIGKNCAQAAVK